MITQKITVYGKPKLTRRDTILLSTKLLDLSVPGPEKGVLIDTTEEIKRVEIEREVHTFKKLGVSWIRDPTRRCLKLKCAYLRKKYNRAFCDHNKMLDFALAQGLKRIDLTPEKFAEKMWVVREGVQESGKNIVRIFNTESDMFQTGTQTTIEHVKSVVENEAGGVGTIDQVRRAGLLLSNLLHDENFMSFISSILSNFDSYQFYVSASKPSLIIPVKHELLKASGAMEANALVFMGGVWLHHIGDDSQALDSYLKHW